MNTALRERKRADLLSITGAALAGIGAGAWLADRISTVILPVFVSGVLAHAVGMAARHRMDRGNGPLPAVWQWLYVLCWVAIAAVLVVGAWRWFGRMS